MDERDQICYGCMTPQTQEVCPRCGYVRGSKTAPVYLRPGTMLQSKYLIGKVIGHGGFGITYLALDTVLGIKLAIKEYFVSDYATRTPDGQVEAYENENKVKFEDGIRRFLEEARILARLDGNPGIVSVRDFFRANGTAYLVMTYLEGMNLRQYLAKNGPMPFETVRDELMPALCEALSAVHEAGLLHRDISPDNVFMTSAGQAKIIDFGAARQLSGDRQSLSIILKPGYAPEEQYRSRGHQGPWTDVYAVAATFYRAITGKVPAEALDRLRRDILLPPSRFCEIGPNQEQVLLTAMSIYAQDRYKSMAEFCEAMQEARALDDQDDVPTQEREPEQTVAIPAAQVPRWAQEEPAPVSRETSEEFDDDDEDDEDEDRGGTARAMGNAVKLIVVLLVLLLVAAGGYLIIKTVLNSLSHFVPPVPTHSPGISATASPQNTPGADVTSAPGSTDVQTTPEPTPSMDAEITPEPTQAVFPDLPAVEVNTDAAYGAYFADASIFAPQINREYIYASGETVGNLIYRIGMPEAGDVLAAQFITDGASLEQGKVEIYFERDGALYLYDQKAQSASLVLPANVQAGMVWAADGYRCEVLAFAQSVTIKNTEYPDCLVVRRTSAGGSRDLLYQPHVGFVAAVDDYSAPTKAYLRLRFINESADNTADATELCTDAPKFYAGE